MMKRQVYICSPSRSSIWRVPNDLMGVPLAVEGLVVGFCSTVVFLVDDWMTAPDVEKG